MITLFMEMWCAFWSWATGEVDDDSMWKVWDILWRDGGEWYALPAGQHREGFSVEAIRARLDREAKEAARLKASERARLRQPLALAA